MTGIVTDFVWDTKPRIAVGEIETTTTGTGIEAMLTAVKIMLGKTAMQALRRCNIQGREGFELLAIAGHQPAPSPFDVC